MLAVDTLALKVVLTPTLIGAASLAGRRWGPAVSGWLVGLPFTSAPVALFLSLEHGATFAASAALGTMVGTISQAAFALAYVAAGRRGIAAGLVASLVAFALATLALRSLDLPALALFAIVIGALLVALRLLPGRPGAAPAASRPASRGAGAGPRGGRR